jgi:hypothetical protein
VRLARFTPKLPPSTGEQFVQMQSAEHKLNANHCATCVANSKRVGWDIDGDVIRGRSFDFTKRFLLIAILAVVAGSLHAQVCSGGADGGIDAAGDQCGDAATVSVYANDSSIASSRPTAKKSEIHQSTAATAGTRPTAKMSPRLAVLDVSAQGATRIVKAALPASALLKTSKIKTVDPSPCSGGPDGGMDATGNQCNEHAVAGTK